jgi:hypothetical protein
MPRRYIKFHYTNVRPDDITANMSGVMSVVRSLLVWIDAYAPNPVLTKNVWTYLLEYTTSSDTKRSLLQRIPLALPSVVAAGSGALSGPLLFLLTNQSRTVDELI